MISALRSIDSCPECELAHRCFLGNLSREALEAFQRLKQTAIFPEHAVVLVEGQRPTGVFVLCQGRAKLSTTSRDGKTLIVRIAEAGEVLGLDSVVSGQRYELTAETMQPCQLDYISSDDLLRFMKEHPEAGLRAIRHLARDCGDAYGLLRTIGLSHSVTERFARFLLDSTSETGQATGKARVRLAMTHEEISQLIGTSRETVTRLLSEFRRNELAELRGSMLIIHNRPRLQHMARA